MSYMQEYEKWLASPALNEQEHAELESIRDDEKEIRERFYGPLEFGTAGLRGTMKVGLHQMNIHVIRWATQGFANVICAEGEEAKRRGVALCMDCRNHSMEFARAAAEVCAANGIHVRIFESLRPTPELSFAVREYDCQAGINVTASHNPKEYNGYKVYWSDGAQLPPSTLPPLPVSWNRSTFSPASAGWSLTMPRPRDSSRSWAPRRTNGSCPTSWPWSTTGSPWPRWPIPSIWSIPLPRLRLEAGTGGTAGSGREASALCSGADGAGRQLPHGGLPIRDQTGVLSGHPVGGQGGCRLHSGHRPDSDRVGIMVRSRDGSFIPVTGNQTGVLMLDYLIGAMRRGRQAAGASLLPQDHRHHGDGPEGGGVQRRHLLRHLHRLQVHGGEEERPGGRRRGEGHLLLRGELRLHAGGTTSGTRTPSPPPCC